MPPGVGVGGFGIPLTNVFPVQGFAVVWGFRVCGSRALRIHGWMLKMVHDFRTAGLCRVNFWTFESVGPNL